MTGATSERTGPARRWGLWWALALGWWSVNGVASATQYHLLSEADGRAVSWGHAFATGMTSALLWVPLTVMALWLTERYPVERGRWGRAALVHGLSAVAVVVLRAAAVAALNRWVGWYPVLPPLGSILLHSVQNNLFFYWLLVGVAHALHYARTAREREAQLARSQLQALTSQIQPHFLFNALNTVASLMHQDVEAADRTLARLSTLLRRTLDSADAPEVALRDELSFLGAYLEIEQARFEDRLTVDWEVDPEVLDARVPHLILQPVVENAIRHGIGERSAPGTIRIAAQREKGCLSLRVEDDGVGLAAATRRARAGAGLGLANTRARLERLYGDRHTFVLSDRAGGGTVVAMTVPYGRAGGPPPRTT